MTDEELIALVGATEWAALGEEDKAALRYSFTPLIPPAEELRALAGQLFARVKARDGRILHRQPFEGAKIHECFSNAMAWVKAHEGHALVYGFSFNHFGGLLRHVRFTPHVAVCTETGEWLDVTPHGASRDYPFLQHAGTEEEFDAAFKHGPMDFIYR